MLNFAFDKALSQTLPHWDLWDGLYKPVDRESELLTLLNEDQWWLESQASHNPESKDPHSWDLECFLHSMCTYHDNRYSCKIIITHHYFINKNSVST